MRVLLVACLLALATGCGDGTKAPEAAPKTPTSSAAGADLVAACDQLGADLKGSDLYDAAKVREFVTQVANINNDGNPSVRAAFRPLAQPLADLANDTSAENHLAFLDALNTLADTCHEAGSTALD